MNWQDGDGPDPTETPGPLNPAAEADYLAHAAEWLVVTEKAYVVWQDPRCTGQDRTDARATVTAAGRLTELNIRMAEACARYQTWRGFTDFKARAAMPAPAAEDMEAKIREQLAADDAAHQSFYLRPGVDDEPPAAGELWTFAEPDDAAGEWFWYALDDIPEDESALGKGYARKNRWLFVQHYAQVLRWQSEKVGGGTIPIPHTWGEIGHDTDGDTVLRRPTADERAQFYGPEPDLTPEQIHEAMGQIDGSSKGDQWITRPVPDGDGGLIDASASVADIAAQPYPRYPQVGPFNDPEPSVLTHVMCPKCGFVGRGLYPGERDHRTAKNDPLCPGCARPPEPAPGTLGEFTDRAGTSLAELRGEELRALQEAIARRIPVVEGRQAPAHTRPGRGPQYHGGEPG